MSIIDEANEVIMHTYGRFPIVMEKGEGMYTWDMEGKKYLDFVAGIAVNTLGHGHVKLAHAVEAQAKKLIHVSNLYYTLPQIRLAKMLTDYTDFDKVFFCNSGAEAIEGSLKLARKYARMKGRDCYEIISMKNSFHGRTFGAITATGQEKYQKGLEPLLPGIKYADFNDIGSLKQAVTDKTCAILLEPVQGEGGILPADRAYLEQVRAFCDEKDIALIFDEVQCGVGRSGYLYAYQHYGVVPDIIASAKGLAGGIPIGAILAKNQVAEAFQPGDHAATFGGNPLATAAGCVVLEELMENGLLEQVRETSQYLISRLHDLKEHFDIICDTRGIGLMQCIELRIPVAGIIAELIEKGLLVVGAGPNCIRLVPSLIVEKAHIDEACQILQQCLQNA